MADTTKSSERSPAATATRRLLYLVPVLVFALIAGYFLWGLDPNRDPSALPSVLIDQPVPEFALPPISGMDGPGLTSDSLRGGEVTLVNVFASWCVPCRIEHPLLMELAQRDDVRLAGINYKNKAEDARPWLADLGNPYDRIGADESGRVAIDWGVYGVPETFVVDGGGRIRYRHVGPLDRRAIEQIILPLVEEVRRR